MRFDSIPRIEEGVLAALRSPAWGAAASDEERKRVIVVSLCEALHPLGQRIFPSAKTVDRYFETLDRNTRIWSEFDGRNYEDLAARYGLSPRTVRMVVEKIRRIHMEQAHG